MDSFLEYLAAKRGMAGALHAVLTDDDDLRMKTRGLLYRRHGDAACGRRGRGERSAQTRTRPWS